MNRIRSSTTFTLVRTDDSGDSAGRRRSPCLSIFRIQHVQILQAGAGVEKHNRIVSAEASGGQQLLISDKRRSALGRSEDAFHLRPVACGLEDLGVGGGERKASAFFQDLE